MLFESIMSTNAEWRASVKGGRLFAWLGQSGGEALPAKRAPGGPTQTGWQRSTQTCGRNDCPVTELDNSEEVCDGLGEDPQRLLCSELYPKGPVPQTPPEPRRNSLFFKVVEQWEAQCDTEDRREHTEPCLSSGLCEAVFWVLEEMGVKSLSSVIWALRVKTQFSP